VLTDLTDSREPFLFLADGNKYFVSAIVPREARDASAIAASRAFGILAESTRGPEPRIAAAAQLVVRIPPPGDPLVLRYHAYFGPKHEDFFAGLDVLGEIARYDRNSWFSIDIVNRSLVAVLRFFARITWNWGVAIILLTLCVRAVIFPINRRSQAQMARYAQQQQALRPKLEELTKRYKNNARKLNEERMKLFREHNVNVSAPLVGCLPVFLQLPIFVGIFSAVRNTYELRQAPFVGWIRDLSEPDNFISFGRTVATLPLIGEIRGINLLPLVVLVLWMVSMRLAPKPTDPQQQQVQKMMIWMPVIFGIALYNYASGLALYMGVSSLSSIVEQTIIKKLWPPPGMPTAQAAKAPAPSPALQSS
jgi:YidC/Oxa1 family membrane protein insertase